MVRRSYDVSEAIPVTLRAEEEWCEKCGSKLWVCANRQRFVQRMDGLYDLVRQDKRCFTEGCLGWKRVYRVHEDLRIALPRANFGTDVVLEIGERHLQHGDSFARLAREFCTRGVEISKRHVPRLFRSYVALTKATLGKEERIREALRAQGGILLMADGVQFDATSPVLYMVWDALSGTPLFGERKAFRSADDLVPLLERVKAMDVEIIGVVSDKEKGLVPAIARVFPDAPHQLCQRHFLGNCATGMKETLQDVARSVADRADRAQKIAKQLHVQGWDSAESDPSSRLPTQPRQPDEGVNLGALGENTSTAAKVASGSLSEEQLVVELCAMARGASRATGRAPMNPPELVRHHRLESVRQAVALAQKKGPADKPFLT